MKNRQDVLIISWQQKQKGARDRLQKAQQNLVMLAGFVIVVVVCAAFFALVIIQVQERQVVRARPRPRGEDSDLDSDDELLLPTSVHDV